MNYARDFAGIEHEFIVTILIPMRDKSHYAKVLSEFDLGVQSNVIFSPVFLESPNENLQNLLNLHALRHDFVEIIRTIIRHRPDAVIGMYIIHAYPLVLLKRLLGFKLFVIVSGGDLYFHQGLIWRIVRRAIYSSSMAVFPVGHELKAGIEREGGHHVFVIPTGADPDRYRPIHDLTLRRRYGFDVDHFVVLTLCDLIERKCVDDVIKAIGQLQGKHANVKMIVAGDGPHRDQLMQLCSSLRLTDRVMFTGSVNDTTKRDLFNVADVYVLASTNEGMPFSLMEAMSCGCISIGSNVGDIPNLIDDSENGFLVRPREPQSIAGKIEEIMAMSKEQLSLMRKRARQTILDKYDSKKLTRNMVDIIQRKTSNS